MSDCSNVASGFGGAFNSMLSMFGGGALCDPLGNASSAYSNAMQNYQEIMNSYMVSFAKIEQQELSAFYDAFQINNEKINKQMNLINTTFSDILQKEELFIIVLYILFFIFLTFFLIRKKCC
jgi:predicted PurR-regulated permease PerM